MTEKIIMTLFLIMAIINITADIPTHNERVKNSGLNPEYNLWKADLIRLLPVPIRKKGKKWPMGCYRYDFELPAAARKAQITFLPSIAQDYSVYVNGKKIVEPMPERHRGIRNVELTKYLKKGHNVIAFKGEAVGGGGLALAAEGIVFCTNGETVRLLSNIKQWRAGYNLADGWELPDFELMKMRRPKTLKTPQKNYYAPMNPPYYGPIQVSPANCIKPIFDEDKPVELKILLLNVRKNNHPETALNFTVMDEFSREIVKKGNVELKAEGEFDYTARFQVENLKPGAYQIKYTLDQNNKGIDSRLYEIAVVGKIKQQYVEGTHYEDGMKLKEVYQIDCTQEPKEGEFITWRYKQGPFKTVVKDSPLGKYRTLPESWRYSSFGYRVKVKNLYKPHLVVIDWPDDAPRSFLSHIYEKTSMIPDRYPHPPGYVNAGYQRGDSAFFSNKEHPVITNKMRKLRYIYWPNEEEATVFIYSVGGDAPGAVSKITIYEITNDLPALKVDDYGDRLIGYHTERGPQSMSAAYYAGPLGAYFGYLLAGTNHPEFYRSWYTTTSNMIKRMRFSGQNLYLMGHLMYNGVLYPSKEYIYSPNCYSAGDDVRDYNALILRMFEQNGLKMISNIEYTCTKELMKNLPTETEIKEGAPTWLSVNKFGRVQNQSWCVWVNFFHPKVQKSVLTVTDELLELYKDYPAWKGICFVLCRWFGGPIQMCGYKKDESPLDWGYGDFNIDLFEQETGINVPVEKQDQNRFMKRYDWLMKNQKQKWINWRCQQYTKLYQKIRNRIVKARPDLKLYLVNMEPTLTYGNRPTKQTFELEGHYDDQAKIKKVLKGFGFDIDQLKKENSINISYTYASSGAGPTFWEKRSDYTELLVSQQWQDVFANDAKGGAYLWTGLYHAGYKFPEGKWLFRNSVSRQGFPLPRFINDGLVNIMVRSNPTWFPHTWIDVVDAGGRLHEIRQFARAYLTLPNGKYKRLAGNGLDKNIWIGRTLKNGTQYFYVANTQWWTLNDVRLLFVDGVKIYNLTENKTVTLKDKRWNFSLKPYEIKTFKITGEKNNCLESAEVKIKNDAKQKVITMIEEAYEAGLDVTTKAHAREKDIKHLPAWKQVEKINGMLLEINEYLQKGFLSKAYNIACSGKLKTSCDIVITNALEVMPFLILGPFGRKEDTNIINNKGNPAVIKEFNGLETPYLNEYEGSGNKLPRKIPEVKIDFTREYDVYPNVKRKWQKVEKKEFLSFLGKCHSESPFWMSCYAYTEIYSPKKQNAILSVGSDNALAIWLNGKLVLKYGGYGTSRGGQRSSMPNQNRVVFPLKKGWNKVLLKAVQRGPTRIYFRLTDNKKHGIDNLQYRLPETK